MADSAWLAIVGPTATGKSDLAVAVAQQLDGEIVNADASQFYRGMDIGTAKLPVADRQGVPHHLLDVLDVDEEASVAVFQRQARKLRDDIVARGKVPILVGGSGLYVRAALDVMEFPPTDAAVRARLEAECDRVGVAVLRDRLVAADPLTVSIEPNNARRIIRALEVMEITGRPFSATMPRREYVYPAVQVGLAAPRSVLDDRIDRRVGHMVDQGLVDEVRRVDDAGIRRSKTASRALGYAQVLPFLPGEVDVPTAVDHTAQATRRFARRQLSWFGADERVTWLVGELSVASRTEAVISCYQRLGLGA